MTVGVGVDKYDGKGGGVTVGVGVDKYDGKGRGGSDSGGGDG